MTANQDNWALEMTFNFERRLATFKQFNWPHTLAKTGPKNSYKAQPEEV